MNFLDYWKAADGALSVAVMLLIGRWIREDTRAQLELMWKLIDKLSNGTDEDTH